MEYYDLKVTFKKYKCCKSIGTQPEIRIEKALWSLGYRYRKNNKTVFF
ncbi:PDDEXK family nuclease [Flavobacterium aquicola]|nr:hypothetical protein [Flavobacterium aquicola]